MLNLSRVVNNPRFAQAAVIQRSSGGGWVAGVWSDTTADVGFYGIIKPATSEDLEQVPEADRVTGAITLHSQQPIYLTRTSGPTNSTQGLSDIVLWHGQQWRVMHLWEWNDFGYFKGMAVRMGGE